MTTICGWIMLGTAALFDVRSKKVPVRVIVATGILALIASAAMLYRKNGTAQELLASVMPGAALLLMALISKESVGYGDGLFLAAAGPLFGWRRALLCVPAGFLLATILSVVLLTLKRADRKTKIPFIPFLAAGMGVVSLAL